MSPAVALGVWFVWAGVKAGAIPSHQEPFAERTATGSVAIANALLEAHSLEEIKARSQRLFARKVAKGPNRLMAGATIAFLAEHWEWFESDDTAPPSRRVGREMSQAERDLVEELQAQERAAGGVAS